MRALGGPLRHNIYAIYIERVQWWLLRADVPCVVYLGGIVLEMNQKPVMKERPNCVGWFDIFYDGTPIGTMYPMASAYNVFFWYDVNGAGKQYDSEELALKWVLERFLERFYPVDLSSNHEKYSKVYLYARYHDNPDTTVVSVDVARFMRCFTHEQGRFYLSRVEDWPVEPVNDMQRIGNFLDPSTGAAYMPYVSFRVYRKQSGWWPFRKNRSVGVVSFSDGRHRARYLEYAGARIFPVEVSINEASLLSEWCGALD